MTATSRAWVPMPSWWIPVWVTLQAERGPRDALETAVLAMVRAGVQRVAAIAQELCMNVALIQSAVERLASVRALEEGDDGLLSAPQTAAEMDESLEMQLGYVAWDQHNSRPLLQIWLDEDVASETLARGDPGDWEVIEHNKDADMPERPARNDIKKWLQLLPNVSDLRVFEPFGSGVREIDGAKVAKLRPVPSGRHKACPIWVPLEHRALGPVVWRPSLVPMQQVETELDAGGWAGLLAAASPAIAKLLEESRKDYLDTVMPGVIQQVGFAKVEEFKASISAAVRKEFGDLALSEQLRVAAENGCQMQKLGEVLGADWRALAKPWSTVLDLVTMELTAKLRPVMNSLVFRELHGAELAEVENLLGQTWPHVRGLKGDFKELRNRLRGDADTLGQRVLLFGVCAAFDPRWRLAFVECNRHWPGIFGHLDRAVQMRNDVEHARAGAEILDVEAFRALVVRVVKGLTGLGI